MKIRQTYITSFLTLVLAFIWMLSGLLSDKDFEVKGKSKLETISSVTVLNSNGIKKAKKITQANVILSKYRSGSSEINIDNKISSVIINKYNTNISSVKNNRDVKSNQS